MSEPISIAMPSVAMPQVIVTGGMFPNFQGGPDGYGTAASLGFILNLAFEPTRIQTVAPAQGQFLNAATPLYSLLGNTYWDGNPKLPDLQGSMPFVKTQTFEGQAHPIWGAELGHPGNQITLNQWQMPPELGGRSIPIDNQQEALTMQYLIQVSGTFPSGNSPTMTTIGMVYPFAGPVESERMPAGFLPADGRLLNIDEYKALAAVVGTTYGGDGVNTFALPDLRNRVPVGMGLIPGGDELLAGSVLGAAQTVITDHNLPVVGSGQVNVQPPSLGMRYIINTDGLYQAYDTNYPMLGQVTLYAGQYLPGGWMQAQGQVLAIAQHQALFSLLGTHFGGDGEVTFALPNLSGRAIIGTGGVNNLQIGDKQGSAVSALPEGSVDFPVIVPGVQLVVQPGQISGNKVTGKLELDIAGVWPQARVEYSTDGTTWSETFAAQEGSNTLYVRQINVLGQASAATRAITFVLDTTAPEAPEVVVDGVAVAAPLAAPAFKAAVPADSNDTIPRTSTGKLSFGKVEDGAILEFSIDGGQTWSDTFEAQPGLNQVQVRQVDMAGNVSPASELIQFYWDGSDTEAAVTSTTTHSTGGNLITVEQHGALATGLGTANIDLLIHGHQQDVALPDDIEHIRLTENGLNNTVTGNAQDNVFEVIVGNWVIEGSGGQDTVKLSNALADYVITQESHNGQLNGQLQATLYGPEGRIIVRDVETIEFSDVTLIKTTGTDITEIDHLYEEVLGRSPDAEGLTYWVEQMNQGATLQDVAQALAESTEFKQLYGTPSEEQLVEELYEAILNRAPDTEGLAYWTEALVVHEATEGELIISLLTSAESQSASTNQVSGNGLFVPG
ncbi:tail fiber protein [Orrella daihaiensis]|uniref:Tail fiber protein n=1 Tax=Orrella daihaiensis TaxID=2782176 RepID=A0ABY4AJB8_9BURK|nr:tail fiber protein [Orrella daihaiensis]